MGPRRLLFLAVALLILPGPALRPAAPPPQELMRPLRAAILASQPFRVDFTQQVYVDGELEMEESGVIVFAHRELIKWEYLDPESKIFILEGDRYRFYDRENNQLLLGRVDANGEQLIWELLLAEQPGGAVRWDAASRTVFLSVPGQEEAQQLQVLVGADFLPQRVEQASGNGLTTVYRFRDYRRRVALAADEFDLHLPAGVDTVEEAQP